MHKTEQRFVEETTIIPSQLLSSKILEEIYDRIHFVPSVVYVCNSAPDWCSISCIDKEGQVWTITEDGAWDEDRERLYKRGA